MPVKGTLYTYPDNFRAFKALIAAKYSGANVKLADNFVFGETNKSKQFLAKFPFGKVPAYEDETGLCLFESNAIAYHVANDALRGGNDEAARAQVQQWMSFADSEILPSACTWVFPVLGIMHQNKPAVDHAKEDLTKALKVLDEHLLKATFLVGERVSLADIAVCCTLLLPFKHVLDPSQRKQLVNVTRWFNTMVHQPNVKAVVGDVSLCSKAPHIEFKGGHGDHHKGHGGHGHGHGHGGDHKKHDKKPAPKKEAPKKEEKKKDEEQPPEDDGMPAPEKTKDPLATVPKGNFDMDDFKRFYSNNDEVKSVPYFWEKFDKEHYSIWRCDYKYNDELAMVFMSSNLIGGMYQRLDKLRKYAFASMCVFGENNNSTISGIWIWRGQDLVFELSEDWQIDYSSYDWKKLDPNSDETKKLVEQYLKWEGTDKDGRKFADGKIYK